MGSEYLRQATASDIYFIDSILREAADANGDPAHEQPTAQKLLADLFESSPAWCGLLAAERDGAALAAATYRRSYWSWSGRTLVLTGLYVRPPARRKGLGRRLVLELCRLALAEQAQLDWLQPRDPAARALLAQFGAHRNHALDGHCAMRIPLNSITLAANGPSGIGEASSCSQRRDRNDGVHNQSSDADRTVAARLARPDDMPAINDMIKELAAYQGHPDGPKLTVKDLEEDGFACSSPWFFAFVAERGGVAVGMVMGNRAWDGTRRHYLQSLYVRPNARRCGVADLLIQKFCKFSMARGVEHVDLDVANDNAPAQKLYRRLRAVDVTAADVPAAYRLSSSQIKDIILQSQM